MLKNLSSIKEELQERRRRLKKELGEIARKSNREKNSYEAKFPEYGRAEDENAEEVAAFMDSLSLGESLAKALTAIEIALKKINRGKYGICEACGKKISKERLKILPTAGYCLSCKKDRIQEI
ncbi:TraR/DksA C4-type zinc finger protein [Patescibacteria group bacterium]|nr:TraR/DksA C4-type zinc finger protein [Patescibacteria group bacterium]